MVLRWDFILVFKSKMMIFYFFNVRINFDSHLTENMSDIQKDFSRGTLLKINLNLS